ncbi:hypothetical protein C8J56DRAFT_1113555, partial [Mycena floridula]
ADRYHVSHSITAFQEQIRHSCLAAPCPRHREPHRICYEGWSKWSRRRSSLRDHFNIHPSVGHRYADSRGAICRSRGSPCSANGRDLGPADEQMFPERRSKAYPHRCRRLRQYLQSIGSFYSRRRALSSLLRLEHPYHDRSCCDELEWSLPVRSHSRLFEPHRSLFLSRCSCTDIHTQCPFCTAIKLPQPRLIRPLPRRSLNNAANNILTMPMAAVSMD